MTFAALPYHAGSHGCWRAANPEHPEEIQVSRPSDALAAKTAASQAFTGLLLGLGATKGQVRSQFLAEALLLSALGGAAGVVLGGWCGPGRA